MKEAFADFNFDSDKLGRIEKANEIIEKYQAQSLKLTLRQLYYQHVVENLITNEEKSYKTLGKLISDGRLAGLIDWEAIEDRVRVPRVPLDFTGIDDLLDTAFQWYRLPRWKDQENYVELWVEKDALSGVLRPLATEFHVTLMVNKGYSSQSAMYEAARRFKDKEDESLSSILFYLGDHDPSGEDMVRDIQARLQTFGSSVRVEKLALTYAQVKQFKPPPNPAKMSDSRAAGYVQKYGRQSWEVDALPPTALAKIIRAAFSSVVDTQLMDGVKSQEELDKKRLRAAASKLRKKE